MNLAVFSDPARRVAAVRMFGMYLGAFAVALGVSGTLVMVTGGSAFEVFQALWDGSISSWPSISLTIDESVPVLVVALGIIVATRAGIVNIGPEGQLLIGGLTGAAAAIKLPVPDWMLVPATLIGAALGGAVWAGIAAVLQYKSKVDVVISTLLLNLVAIQVVSFAVGRSYLLQENTDASFAAPQSDQIPSAARLPILGTYGSLRVSSGVFIAIALLVVVGVLVTRSRWGFRLRMLGLNAEAAHRVGIRAAIVGGGALIVSGATAGLAGGIVLSDRVFRIQSGFSNNLGYNGLLVALIARRNPWAAVPAALLFGVLRAGGGFVSTTGVPRYVVDIMQALIVLAALFPPMLEEIRARRAARKLALQRANRPTRATAPVLEVAS
ncbi:ABC transporter permease [Desertimonas flava]|jgi:simple sugar transport system permease protein|uniref:ABC transporter permease n=1 Tax=Desertimonas flava TaxID=2064846 RepID=UPI000E34377B|nr:ABC transporter permease [Desertimonas flava]